MASILWLGGTSGTYSFNTAANWSGDVVPGASDVAYFEAAQTGPYTVSGNATVGAINVESDIVTLTGNIAFSNEYLPELRVDGGSLTIATGASVTGNETVYIAAETTIAGALSGSSLTVVSNGVLGVAAGATVAGEIILSGGTLSSLGVNSYVTIDDVIDVSAASTLTAGGVDTGLAITGAFNGTAPLTMDTAVALEGRMSRYTGTITINSSGALQFFDQTAAPDSFTGNIVDDGSLSTQDSALTLSGAISGSGQLFNFGITTLTGADTYSGGTALYFGTLALGTAGALGTGALAFLGGELLATTTQDVSNTLNMSNNVTIAAAPGQVLTIGGPNPWSFSPSAGDTLTFGAPGENGTVLWQTNSSSTYDNVTGPELIVQDGTLKADDSNFYYITFYGAGTTVDAGAAIDINGFVTDVTDLQGAGDVINSGGATSLILYASGSSEDTFSGVIAGPTQLIVQSGDQGLTGTNSYTGGTVIGSTLTLGNGGTTGSILGNIGLFGPGTLAIDESGVVTLNGVISLNGTLVQEGTGTTTLTADNTYSGGTTISAGTLELGQSTSAGTGAITVGPGSDATLQIDGSTMPSNLIANFAPGDRIDLANIAAQSFAFSGPAGTLTAINNTGGIITDYSFPLSTTGGDDFVIGPDGQGGTMITSVPIASDFNGDGKSDVLLNDSNGQFVDWTMNGPQITAAQMLTFGGNPITLPTSWNTAGIGDFNGDGKADILLQNANGTFVDWQMNGSQIASAQMVTSGENTVMLPSSWNIAGTGDFNGDGKSDILLQNTNGTFVDWQMNGSQVASAQMLTSMGNPVTLPSSWSVAGVGDFNGDGQDDILMRNTGGAFVDWTMNGSQITAAQGLTYQGNAVNLDASWSVVGVGDLNGDGRDDILLRNTSGTFVDWTMNGSQITAAQGLTFQGNPIDLDASWSVAGIGDFNNTGQDMILLHNTNGTFVEWTLNGSAAITSAQMVTDQGNPVMLPNSFQTAADPATGGGSGTQIVGAGETLTNPIIGGGMLDLQSGAVVNGIITFAAGSTGTLLDADQAPLPDTVMGFGEGADYLSFSGQTTATETSVVASAQRINGNTVLTFPDHTSITLVGITHVDTGIFA